MSIETIKALITNIYDKGWKAGRAVDIAMSDAEIWTGYQECMQNTTQAFKAGVKFAERKHGIGVDDEDN